MGHVNVLFDNYPQMTVKCGSYCTIAKLDGPGFNEIMKVHYDLKDNLINSIIKNPYDIDRDFFLTFCVPKIPYLRHMPIELSSQIYYRSKQIQYKQDEIVFHQDEKVTNIYIVLSGIVEIELTDKN